VAGSPLRCYNHLAPENHTPLNPQPPHRLPAVDRGEAEPGRLPAHVPPDGREAGQLHPAGLRAAHVLHDRGAVPGLQGLGAN